MNLVQFFIDWGGHVFSISGIIGGLFLYFRHDRKIKEQERKLNDYQLKKYQEEENLKQQANVRCNSILVDGGHLKVRFFNSGQADARNVRISIINKDNLLGIEFNQDWGPYDLISPQIGYREEDLYLCEGCTEEIQLCMTWDDDFGNNRNYQQTLQIV